jgi:hypothetical protein
MERLSIDAIDDPNAHPLLRLRSLQSTCVDHLVAGEWTEAAVDLRAMRWIVEDGVDGEGVNNAGPRLSSSRLRSLVFYLDHDLALCTLRRVETNKSDDLERDDRKCLFDITSALGSVGGAVDHSTDAHQADQMTRNNSAAGSRDAAAAAIRRIMFEERYEPQTSLVARIPSVFAVQHLIFPHDGGSREFDEDDADVEVTFSSSPHLSRTAFHVSTLLRG